MTTPGSSRTETASARWSPLETVTLSHAALRARAFDRELYAVLDACDAPQVIARIQRTPLERAVSLYRGSAEEDWWAIAPYLVRVDFDTLDWIASTLWREPWGIFVLAPRMSLDEVRLQLRRFLKVHAPTGETMYFRFYDPRVIEVFLASCTGEELSEFYGSLEGFGVAIGDDSAVGGRFLRRGVGR